MVIRENYVHTSRTKMQETNPPRYGLPPRGSTEMGLIFPLQRSIERDQAVHVC